VAGSRPFAKAPAISLTPLRLIGAAKPSVAMAQHLLLLDAFKFIFRASNG
jgi:hypothetical protein